MNNLVKFLILGFLILWPASLSADKVKAAFVKCDIERVVADMNRKLLLYLDLTNMSYYAHLSVTLPMDHGDFWEGGDDLEKKGANNQFYVFNNLDLFRSSGRLWLDPAVSSLIMADDELRHSKFSAPSINRETLELDEGINFFAGQKIHNCTLINEQEHSNYVKEWKASFDDFFAADLKRAEEEERERERQRERFKL